MLSPCAPTVPKPSVKPELTPTCLNFTIYFWGLFSLPASGPAWFSLAVICLESEFRPIFRFSPQNSICTAMTSLIFQVGKYFPWIWSGDIYLCLTHYSKIVSTLLCLNKMKHCWGGPGMQNKRDNVMAGPRWKQQWEEHGKENNPKWEWKKDTNVQLGKIYK